MALDMKYVIINFYDNDFQSFHTLNTQVYKKYMM